MVHDCWAQKETEETKADQHLITTSASTFCPSYSPTAGRTQDMSSHRRLQCISHVGQGRVVHTQAPRQQCDVRDHTVKAVLSFHLYVSSRDQTGCQTCTASTLPTETSRRPKILCGKDIQTKISLSSQKLFAIDIPAGKGKISLLHEPFLGTPTILQTPWQGVIGQYKTDSLVFVVEFFSSVLLIYF